LSDLDAVHGRAREFFATGTTRDVSFRAAALRRLSRAIETREGELLDALYSDLHKSAQEAYASELGVVQTDIAYTLRRLARWTKVHRRPTAWALAPARGEVRPEPLGLALILGPWNFPFQLLFSPLVAALAAGNCVLLKPSELAPALSAAAARLVRECFEPGHVTLVEGDADVARGLVALDLDHIFFTGSTSVGRQVMAAAAQRLTPVTLELGGKCPCILAPDARPGVAARRIAWGKFLNAGQTCVAPDHVWVHRSRLEPFVAALRRTLAAFFGDDPRSSPDFGRIVNLRHFERLAGYLDQGRIVHGGETDAAELYIAPTLLVEPQPAAAVMTDEIFGPILPILAYDDLDDLLAALAGKPRPLALYLFSDDRSTRRRVLERSASGGVCINDVINHLVPKELPFGGVGQSGMGQYHGKAGFDCFTHYRSVLTRSSRFDPGFAYPPPKVKLETLKRAYRVLFRN
jgi:aldehyde dehydrogenase (NAD+)